MTPLHSQAATTTILLLVLPTVSALVPSLSIQQIQSSRNNNFRKIGKKTTTATTQLSLAIDPTEIAQHAHHAMSAGGHVEATTTASSTLDFLSTFTLAKASNIIPNQSLAPLTETVQSGTNNMVDVIPDMTSMPGGVPRSGNPFLAESFRELYDGTLKSPPPQAWNSALQTDGTTLVVPAREWDVVARYADLLNRIPLAAAVYALIDFFLINAEEDLAIVELLDEEEQVEAILEVENKVLVQRFVGLFMVVAVTIAWSFLSYHPVPFGEL